jgi:hypothetical protein
MGSKAKNGTAKGQIKLSEVLAESSIDNIDPIYRDMGIRYSTEDEWMVKYEVNEKGIGRILLPPTLSTLLQSDRVSIVPSGGGLFIRSVVD